MTVVVEEQRGSFVTTVDLSNAAVAKETLQVIALFHPDLVDTFIQENQAKSAELNQYRDQVLAILGLRRFMTNSAFVVIAERMSRYLTDPKDAAEEIRRYLMWTVDEKHAIQILMNEVVDGLYDTEPLKRFVRALMQNLREDPIVIWSEDLIEKLSIARLNGGSSVLRSLAEAYWERFSPESVAETLWQFIQESEAPVDFIRLFRIKYRKAAQDIDQRALEDLALALLAKKESRAFFDTVGTVVNLLNLPDGVRINSTFGVMVRLQLNEMAVGETTPTDLQRAQMVADRIRAELVENAPRGFNELKAFLSAKYNLSNKPEHQKALTWLTHQFVACFGQDSPIKTN